MIWSCSLSLGQRWFINTKQTESLISMVAFLDIPFSVRLFSIVSTANIDIDNHPDLGLVSIWMKWTKFAGFMSFVFVNFLPRLLFGQKKEQIEDGLLVSPPKKLTFSRYLLHSRLYLFFLHLIGKKKTITFSIPLKNFTNTKNVKKRPFLPPRHLLHLYTTYILWSGVPDIWSSSTSVRIYCIYMSMSIV